MQGRVRTIVLSLIVMAMTLALTALGAAPMATLTARAASTTSTLNATADTYLDAAATSTNYGGASTLKISQTSNRVLVRFRLGLPVGTSITSVKLRIYSNTTVNGNVVVHPSSSQWEEAAVTWNGQPAWQNAELARSTALRSGKYVDIPLPTSSVLNSADASFGLNATTTTTGSLASRESRYPPQLVVTYAPAPTAPPTTTAPPKTPPALPTVAPLRENASFSGSGDVADDTAIWVDPTSPGNSLVIADNKATSGGGVGVFDMNGSMLQFRQEGAIGNVDLRTDFPLSGSAAVLVGGNNRTTNTMALWLLDTTTGTLSPVAARSISTFAPNYGFCMYHSKVSGKFYAFVTPNGAGSIQQFELLDNGAGKVDAVLVRTLPMSSITESCVADDDLGQLYVGQEDVGLWKYGAEPSAGTSRSSVDTAGGGRLVADIEGMSIAYGPSGSGYLFVSSQGDSTIAVYDRAGNNAFLRKFKVVANGAIDAVTGTDGLDVTSLNVGPGFEQGLLVVHDESNTGGTTSNLKYVPLGSVLQAIST